MRNTELRATGSILRPSTRPSPGAWSWRSSATAPPITRPASARDRDRLRQEHLERLGWRFHRIWSQDWFTDKQSEIAKAMSAYQTAVQTAEIAQAEIGTPRVAQLPKPGRRRPAVTERQRRCPTTGLAVATVVDPARSRVGRLSIDEYSHAELAELIQWIESDTLLRPKEQLIDEAMRELGFQRRGRKIIAAIEQAIESTRHRGVS